MRTLPFLRDGDMTISHVDVFSPFFSAAFLPSLPSLWLIYCPLPPLRRSRKHPPLPWDFSECFLLMHTYFIYHRLGFFFFSFVPFWSSSAAALRWGAKRVSLRHRFSPPCRGAGLRFADRRGLSCRPDTGVAPSLGYLLLFLTVRPHKQNGGLLFLLLWYGGRGAHATLGVKREAGGVGGEAEEEGGSLRGCSGLSVSRFRALSLSLPISLFSFPPPRSSPAGSPR